jgi:hypothetical protein
MVGPQGHNRRADIVIFLNGLPLSVIELKNPADEKATIGGSSPGAPSMGAAMRPRGCRSGFGRFKSR